MSFSSWNRRLSAQEELACPAKLIDVRAVGTRDSNGKFVSETPEGIGFWHCLRHSDVVGLDKRIWGNFCWNMNHITKLTCDRCGQVRSKRAFATRSNGTAIGRFRSMYEVRFWPLGTVGDGSKPIE
jgi:hypothetical protein